MVQNTQEWEVWKDDNLCFLYPLGNINRLQTILCSSAHAHVPLTGDALPLEATDGICSTSSNHQRALHNYTLAQVKKLH